jgi:TatD DNase family protein
LAYKNSQDPAVAAAMPLDKILIETDCPFLTPVPFRGKRNHPALVRHVRAKLAEIKDIPEADVDNITTTAARKLFRLNEKTQNREN